MNLRELVALLECQKPEASEFEVRVDQAELPIRDIHIDTKTETVWLMFEVQP